MTGGSQTYYQEWWSSPAIDGTGNIYIGNNDFNLYSISNNGSVNWTYATQNELFQSPVIDNNGNILFASEDNICYSVSPSGDENWQRSFTQGDEIPLFIAVRDDNTAIITFGNSTRIMCFDAATGIELWITDLPIPLDENGITGVTIAENGQILVFGGQHVMGIAGSSPLSSQSPWPKFQQGIRNRGASFAQLPNEYQENVSDQKYSIRPNPAGNMLFISGLESTTTVQIFSSAGELALQDRVDEVMDISSLIPGSYLLILSAKDERNISMQFVKSRE